MGDFVADFGSGTGIISLLVYGRYSCSVVGFEINGELADMMQRSIILNSLEDKIMVENMDLREAYRHYNGAFDVCVCNPPYYDAKAHIIPRIFTGRLHARRPKLQYSILQGQRREF